MKQKALVKEVSEKYAVIEVTRAAMCDGCSQKDCNKHTCSAGEIFGAGKKVTAKAQNPIGAMPGDTVYVETQEKVLLWSAVLVFLMPLLFSGVFYWLGDLLFRTSVYAYCFAGLGFILAFCLLGYIEHFRKGKVPDIVIVAIQHHADNQNDEFYNIQNDIYE